MRRFRRLFRVAPIAALAAMILPLGAYGEAHEYRGTDHHHAGPHGPYVKLGANIGAPSFDASGVDGEVGGGVAAGVGYRLAPWFAGELGFDYLGGSDVEVGGNEVGELDYFAFTFNAKAFPFAALEEAILPHSVEPYLLLGIGGGEVEFETGTGEAEEGTFVVRLGGGIDFALAAGWGAFMDGGYHFLEDETGVDGIGIFTLGVTKRF